MDIYSSFICVSSYNYPTSICISYDSTLYSFGNNIYGAHGHENSTILIPKEIKDLINIKIVSCGDYHTICLNYDGNVFTFGSNEEGQLGIGDIQKQTHIPQKLDISSIKHVSCGEYFTVCLSEDGILYSFGNNNYGQLGLGNNKTYYTPQQIPNLNEIELAICGDSSCVCKTYNNEFYSWGYNSEGELGQGHCNNTNTPYQCKNWPDDIISIKSGKYHTLLLSSKGQVYSFGFNTSGQAGLNDRNNNKIISPRLIQDIPEIRRIECGYNHSMCIDINNNLWVFGTNYEGQLGLGKIKKIFKPVMLHPNLPDLNSFVNNILDISSGGNSTFVKTIDNKIYAFGNNSVSQLGIKTSEEIQLTPIQVFQDKEDIWCSKIGKSRAKSARK